MVSQPPTRADILGEFHNSRPSEWKYHEVLNSVAGTGSDIESVWVYENDVRMRIERGRPAVDDFQEDWVEDYPDSSAKSDSYWLYFGRSPISHRVLVSVDGHRAKIPIPNRTDGELVIDKSGETWGRIVTRDRSSFERALQYPDIQIES